MKQKIKSITLFDGLNLNLKLNYTYINMLCNFYDFADELREKKIDQETIGENFYIKLTTGKELNVCFRDNREDDIIINGDYQVRVHDEYGVICIEIAKENVDKIIFNTESGSINFHDLYTLSLMNDSKPTYNYVIDIFKNVDINFDVGHSNTYIKIDIKK